MNSEVNTKLMSLSQKLNMISSEIIGKIAMLKCYYCLVFAFAAHYVLNSYDNML